MNQTENNLYDKRHLPPFFPEWFCVRCLEKEKSENLVCYDRIPP